MPCVVEEDVGVLEMDGRPRSSIGDSSLTVVIGASAHDTLGLEGMPDVCAKEDGRSSSALKDGSLSDSFDRSFVLVDNPNSINSLWSEQSHAGSGLHNDHRHHRTSQVLQPPSDRLMHLFTVGSLVHQLALAKQEGGCPGDAFAAMMLSLQVLDRVRYLAIGDPGVQHTVDFSLLQARMDDCVRTSEGLSRKLGQSALPNVHEMVFQHALSFSRGAAADELMGNYARSQLLYGKALDLLWFLAEEVDALGLEPQILLTSDEVMRLHQYMASVVARRNACS